MPAGLASKGLARLGEVFDKSKFVHVIMLVGGRVTPVATTLPTIPHHLLICNRYVAKIWDFDFNSKGPLHLFMST